MSIQEAIEDQPASSRVGGFYFELALHLVVLEARTLDSS